MLSSIFGSSDSKTICKTLECYPSTTCLRKILKDPQYESIAKLLDSPGSLTFFCPVNDAVKELEVGSKYFGSPLECFAMDILNCHVVNKPVSSADAPCFIENNCKNPQWVNKGGKGQTMQLCKDECGLSVVFGIPGWPMWTARVLQADVPCSNGKLYLISKALRFPYSTNSMCRLQGQGISFRYCVEDYGLNTLANCQTNISVFMPKSEAVDHVLTKNLGPEIMRETIMAHHVKGCFFSSELKDGQKLETFNGHALVVTKRDGTISINGVPVIEADVIVKNGVIHFIDDVMPLEQPEEEKLEMENLSVASD